MKINRTFFRIIFSLCMFAGSIFCLSAQTPLLLYGEWEFGLNREYVSQVNVPGVTGDPSKMAERESWFKREIKLPDGN
ncbi:hypothetical protein [uncultured Sunxiuqinia sp.]|uniref:hypothetical protein n=1 Tax=uncultured Sunxiuqinia sp. TaxID=1573825 RepID=UPI00374A072C